MKQKSTMENSLNLSGHDTLLQKKNVNKNLLQKKTKHDFCVFWVHF